MKHPPYILHRGFAPLDRDHGGSMRSRQIIRLLESSGTVHSIPGVELSEVRSVLVHLRALRFSSFALANLARSLGLSSGIRWAQRGAIERSLLDQHISDYGSPKMFVTEEIRSIHSATHLAKKGIPIIAFPHNLGYLPSSPRRLAKEFLRILVAESIMCLPCCTVFTISEEEAWLLRNCGVNARLFPYVPDFQRLEKNRAAVNCEPSIDSDSFLLALGTAYNPATMQGLQRLVECAKNSRISSRLVIAGNGTQLLADQLAPDESRVTILGRVDNQTLNRLTAECQAMIVYQDWGVGALTRIVDWSLAGLPIVCNRHAGRSAPPLANIHVCDGESEMLAVADKICRKSRIVPNLPISWQKQIDNATSVLDTFMAN